MVGILKEAVGGFQTHRCSLLAAAISYRVLFSIVPVSAILVAVVGQALRVPEVERQVVDRILERIPVDRSLVTEAVHAVSGSSEPLTLVGALLLLWVSSGMFSTLRDTLNASWGVSGRGFVIQKAIDVAAVLGLGALLLLSILGTTALHTVRDASQSLLGAASTHADRVWDWTASLLPAAVTLAAFLLVYRFVPNVRHGMRDVLPGALLGTVLFEAAKHGFTFYVSRFSRYEVLYGALGTVMLFQLWIYLSANILLFGAELNATLERRRRGGIEPRED